VEIDDGDFPRTYLGVGGECLAAGLNGPMWVVEDKHLGAEHGAADCWVAADSGAVSRLQSSPALAHAAHTCVQRMQMQTTAAAASCGCRQSQRTRAGGYALGRDVRCVSLGCGCLLRARAVARWSQGRLQALVVLQERLVVLVQRMRVCSGWCLCCYPGQSRTGRRA